MKNFWYFLKDIILKVKSNEFYEQSISHHLIPQIEGNILSYEFPRYFYRLRHWGNKLSVEEYDSKIKNEGGSYTEISLPLEYDLKNAIIKSVNQYIAGNILNDIADTSIGQILGIKINEPIQRHFSPDRTPLNLAIQNTSGSMHIVLKRNTPIPCTGRITLSVKKTSTEKICFHIIHGIGIRISGYRLFATVEMPINQIVEPDVFIMTLIFDIDSNGFCHISAISKSGKKLNIDIKGSGGLSKNEIDQILHDYGN